MRTDTVSVPAPTAAVSSFTSYRRRAGAASGAFGASPSSSVWRFAVTSVGGCAMGANLLVGLDTVTMTICDTAPATGADVSRCAIPVRARLIETSCGGCAPSGGRIVADTPSAPTTLWARALADTVTSTVLTVARSIEMCACEYIRVMHGDKGSN